MNAFNVVPAATTPGTARIRSSMRVTRSLRAASFGYATGDNRSCAPRTLAGSKPGLLRAVLVKPRNSSPPHVSSTTTSAASAPMSARRRRSSRRDPTARRLLSAIPRAESARSSRSIGSTPEQSATSVAMRAMAACTRQSTRMSPSAVAVCGSSDRSAGSVTAPSSTPAAVPAAQRIRLSTSCSRSTLPRPAPSATRSAVSPRRDITCARVRLARFADAMSASAATAASSMNSAGRSAANFSVRMSSTPAIHPESVFGDSAITRAIAGATSARSCSIVTPGRSRATVWIKVELVSSPWLTALSGVQSSASI